MRHHNIPAMYIVYTHSHSEPQYNTTQHKSLVSLPKKNDLLEWNLNQWCNTSNWATEVAWLAEFKSLMCSKAIQQTQWMYMYVVNRSSFKVLKKMDTQLLQSEYMDS